MAKTLELNWSEILSDAVREAAHLYDRRILTIGCCAFAIETSSGRLSFSLGTEQRVLILLSFDDAEQDAIGEPGAVGSRRAASTNAATSVPFFARRVKKISSA